MCTKFSSSKTCHKRVYTSLRGVTMAVFCKRGLIGINKLVYCILTSRGTPFSVDRVEISPRPDKCVLELIPTTKRPQTTQSTSRVPLHTGKRVRALASQVVDPYGIIAKIPTKGFKGKPSEIFARAEVH